MRKEADGVIEQDVKERLEFILNDDPPVWIVEGVPSELLHGAESADTASSA